MHVIHADFECLETMPVTALFGAIGVYVLWSRRADVRPSYIGEGNLIARFASEHIGRFGDRMSGYAAIMDASTERRCKSDAEILETILLEIGAEIGQCPVQNDSRGKRKGIRKHYDDGHNVIRLNLTGYHPLRWESKLRGRTEITARLAWDSDEDQLGIDVSHPWRRR